MQRRRSLRFDVNHLVLLGVEVASWSKHRYLPARYLALEWHYVSILCQFRNVATSWSIAGSGDFNSDGKPDILWQNTSTGQRVIWLMNGATFQSFVSFATLATSWSIAGSGDFNGDGKADILWQNTSTGQRVIWLMNGTTFQSFVSFATVDTSWSIAGSGDFNGDGKADILWQNNSTGQRVIWLMNGTTLQSLVQSTPLPTRSSSCGERNCVRRNLGANKKSFRAHACPCGRRSPAEFRQFPTDVVL